ncbi:MAG: chain length determinant family protein [Rhodocyclales bacterium]|nr:chain length determinant family protein [Rhodocyclales bacterium]
MTLQQLILILRARWITVAFVIFMAVVGAITVNWVLPKQYHSTATIVVDTKTTDPVNAVSPQPQPAIAGYLATQVGVVSSERVVRRVVESLNLQHDPDILKLFQKQNETQRLPFDVWISALLTKNLIVRAAPDANLINITMTWTDAIHAAKMANAFAQGYLDTNLELKVEPAKQYANWFQDRTKMLRENLEQAQQRLSAYQRSKGIIITTDEHLDVETARLNELSTQVSALEGLRAESASRQQQAASGRDTMPEVLQNQAVISLKSDLSRLEAKRDEAANRLGSAHPEMERLNAEITALRGRLNTEIGRVAASLTASDHINNQRTAEIRGAMETQRQRVLQMTQARNEIAVLQNDVANAQKAYDMVTQRLAQTSLESQNQTANAMIITPATQEFGSGRPRKLVNLLLALIFGTVFGMGLALLRERLDQRVHGDEDFRTLFGIPVLGVLERAPLISVGRPGRLSAHHMPAIAS